MIDPTTETAKLPLTPPAGIIRFAGVFALPLLLLRYTGKPPAGAAAPTVTVQVALPGAVTLAGLHVTPDCVEAGTRVRVVLVPKAAARVVFPPVTLKAAVMVAVWLLLTAPAVAVKVPLLAPAIVRFGGTVSVVELLDSVTVTPLSAG